jgi:TPR repeat protein
VVKKAAAQGNTDAMYNSFRMLYDTDNDSINRLIAIDYFKQAADKGNIEAQIEYDTMFWEGNAITGQCFLVPKRI